MAATRRPSSSTTSSATDAREADPQQHRQKGEGDGDEGHPERPHGHGPDRPGEELVGVEHGQQRQCQRAGPQQRRDRAPPGAAADAPALRQQHAAAGAWRRSRTPACG
jgi:hypothetical protein